jgi:hypothetical protein
MDVAIERQHAGRVGLDTVLLALGLLDEETLSRFVGRWTGLPPADRGLLGAAGAEAAVFPREWAESLHIAPCRVDVHRVDAVTAVPVAAARRREAEGRSGFSIRLFAAPEFRVREAFARAYGGALAEPHRRLVARFGPATAMPPPTAPRRAPLRAAKPRAAPAGLPPARSRSVAALASFLEGATRRSEVLGALQQFVRSRFAHGRVFVVSRRMVQPADAGRPRTPLDEPCVLSNVVTGGIPYRGPVPPGNEALFANWGRAPPAELALVPLAVGGRVVAVLWGDQGAELLGPAVDELREAAPFAERALARLVARRKRG